MDKRLFLIFACFFVIAFISYVKAVEYPITELGNCASEADCKTFCDVVDNIENCINYAEKNNMMSTEEINEARKYLPYLKAGETPGKCKSESECNDYCNKEENLEECINFAVKVGDISAEEANMIKKTGGKGPGGCNSKKSCDAFCNDEANFNVCVDFAVQYGMISAEEAEMVKATGGKGPGGCNSKESCDAFCSSPDNQQACMEFGIELDLKLGKITPEEAEKRRKEASAPRPGGCRSEQECRDYCSKKENIEECLRAEVAAGRMSEEEYQKQLEGFKGPQTPEGFTEEGIGTDPGEHLPEPDTDGEPDDADITDGTEGTGEGEGTEGGGDTGGESSGGGESGGESGGGSSGGSADAGVTGGVIMETNSRSILVEIKDFFNKLF